MMEIEKHVYTSVCDCCRSAKDVTLPRPASDPFESTPEGWETIFVQYRTLRKQLTHSNDEKRMWLKLCAHCKPTPEAPEEIVKEATRKWFMKLFQARIFGDTRPFGEE